MAAWPWTYDAGSGWTTGDITYSDGNATILVSGGAGLELSEPKRDTHHAWLNGRVDELCEMGRELL